MSSCRPDVGEMMEPMNALDHEISLAYTAHGETPALLSAIDHVLESCDVSEARAAFERAGARDFLGMESDAIPLYRKALLLGLGEVERLRCLVQLGSSLRNVGDTAAAVEVLGTARDEASADTSDWVDAFLALALHADGRPSQGLGIALNALAPHLTRYNRAVASYADDLRDVTDRPSA
jgi:tetratricopeptide (TPR) repeat protein